jgi:hypothetical protein
MASDFFARLVDIFAAHYINSTWDNRDNRDRLIEHIDGVSAPKTTSTNVGVPVVPAAPVPPAYEHAYSEFIRACPDMVEHDRWAMAKADANAFLAKFGKTAADAGWTADDLFGLDPSASMARRDRMGLVWMLRGLTVVDINPTDAALTNGQKYYRPVSNLSPTMKGM